MLKLDTKLFFDKQKITNAADRAEKAALSKFGSYVRQTARRSIRTRKKVAQPNSPPTNRKGTLKRLIFFQYDPQNSSVVIGPHRFGRANRGLPGSALLEHGGKIRKGTKIHRYRKFSYMRPAFEKEIEKGNAVNVWRNSVK